MDQNLSSVDALLAHLFRHQSGKMAALLTRQMGPAYVDVVEDIIQETLEKALNSWKMKGIPANPEGWLFTVARNKAIDVLRSQKKWMDVAGGDALVEPPEEIEKTIEDSVLRLMFACCNPAIAPESQIAFTLKTLGGLTVQEIAVGFNLPEETIAKRIYRAKEKFRTQIALEAPSLYELESRLSVVLQVLYLMFNEGYYSGNPNMVVRQDICAEALRLAVLLTSHSSTARPRVYALVAFMCFHAARLPARVNDQNQIVLLEKQDRSKWNASLIAKGVQYLNLASQHPELSEYHLEAGIASIHALAPTFEKTDWPGLVKWHELLYELKPSDGVALNKAIALGYAESPQVAIEALLRLPQLKGNRFYLVALADFYLQKGANEQALEYYSTALAITKSEFERTLIQKKMERVAVA